MTTLICPVIAGLQNPASRAHGDKAMLIKTKPPTKACRSDLAASVQTKPREAEGEQRERAGLRH